HPRAGITSQVEISTEAAHSGRSGLRLVAAAADPDKQQSIVETAPVWVTSAPVRVEQGDVVQIQGWLRVVKPIEGSVDGLLVIDSLAGEALAERFTKAGEWQQFTMYRAAARAGTMGVTFAVSGLGEAWIDDITIQVVGRGRGGPMAQNSPR